MEIVSGIDNAWMNYDPSTRTLTIDKVKIPRVSGDSLLRRLTIKLEDAYGNIVYHKLELRIRIPLN